jgi:hypothetical protein
MPLSLNGGGPLSRITSQGSMRQVPDSCWRWCCLGDMKTARWRCWVMPVLVLLRWLGRDTMSMPIHAGDITVESRWRWCCWGNLAVARCWCWVMLVTMLLSHVGDDTAEATWTWWNVYAESRWWRLWRSTIKQGWLVLTRILMSCQYWSIHA